MFETQNKINQNHLLLYSQKLNITMQKRSIVRVDPE